MITPEADDLTLLSQMRMPIESCIGHNSQREHAVGTNLVKTGPKASLKTAIPCPAPPQLSYIALIFGNFYYALKCRIYGQICSPQCLVTISSNIITGSRWGSLLCMAAR